ncbi:MAG: hypothetical protein JRE19_13945 [Deltaproteobacteria bacterium]|nr:hypothetical protein [Deltaproteobacteria bacterium]
MRNRLLFLFALLGALNALVPTSFAQLADRVNQIDGFVLEAEEIAYFNEAQCSVSDSTTYQLRLSTEAGTAVSQVYLWAGKQNGECNLNANRTDITANCREITGNPRTLEPDSLLSGLTLQELIDTEIATCDSSGLEGTPYEVFAFRNTDPGSTDVPESDYGISHLTIDVRHFASHNRRDATQRSQRHQRRHLDWPELHDLVDPADRSNRVLSLLLPRPRGPRRSGLTVRHGHSDVDKHHRR